MYGVSIGRWLCFFLLLVLEEIGELLRSYGEPDTLVTSYYGGGGLCKLLYFISSE